jgi:2-polyprenyl-6-methoxyphenol hydroxylase-like FAD-dependent oxidoreductase
MRRHAAIVGGGITGLFSAVLLARSGWRVRVHERGDAIREIGAGIFLKNNSITILERLGLATPVFQRAIVLRRAEVRDHRDVLLQRRTLAERARVYNVPRSDLVLALAAAAREAGAEIVTGSEVVAVEAEGLLRLADGDVERADLVVATDGFRSRPRGQLGLESVARELANGATRFLVPRTAFEAEDITREWWSGRRRIGIAPATRESTYTYMSCPQSDATGAALPVDVDSWRRSFPMLAPFLDRLPGAEGGTRFAYAYVRARRWSSGRVAIAGDAAHAMPPTLGQGAGLAMMNAFVLADTLREADNVPVALAAWEARIRYVTDQTQTWALRYDALMSNWPLWLSGVRRGLIWGFGRSRRLNAKMRIADRVDVAEGHAR